MSSTYRFKQPPARSEASELLPVGDYIYVVTECEYGPNESKSGNGVTLKIKISIQPSGRIIFAQPWTGRDRNGVDRDGIAEFLLSCNRAPKVGEEPDWSKVTGAKGKCRLKIDKDQNEIDRNSVHYFYRPKQANLSPQEGKQQSFSQSEFEKARAKQTKASGSEPEPDNIPY